jgi:hypothetical protein
VADHIHVPVKPREFGNAVEEEGLTPAAGEELF